MPAPHCVRMMLAVPRLKFSLGAALLVAMVMVGVSTVNHKSNGKRVLLLIRVVRS